MLTRLLVSLLATAGFLRFSLAQSGVSTSFTDQETGIVLDTWPVSAGPTLGMALPANGLSQDATEFIGMLSCPTTGWCGMSLGGQMAHSLLVIAYPVGNQVQMSLRFATGYQMPIVYTGPASLTGISHSVNATAFTVLFRCRGCLHWAQAGITGDVSTRAGSLMLGWALASQAPTDDACSSSMLLQQHDNENVFLAQFDPSAASSSYPNWAKLAVDDLSGCSPPASSSRTPAAPSTPSATFTSEPLTSSSLPPTSSAQFTSTSASPPFSSALPPTSSPSPTAPSAIFAPIPTLSASSSPLPPTPSVLFTSISANPPLSAASSSTTAVPTTLVIVTVTDIVTVNPYVAISTVFATASSAVYVGCPA